MSNILVTWLGDRVEDVKNKFGKLFEVVGSNNVFFETQMVIVMLHNAKTSNLPELRLR